MALTIGVQRGLLEISTKLQENGYDVVSMESAEKPLAAVIYSGVNSDFTGFQQLEYYSDQASMSVADNTSGLVLINAQGFNPQEVVSILEGRLDKEA